MASPALHRLESLLQSRRLSPALSGTAARPASVLSSGVPPLDAQLGGGWPYGEVSEIIGPRSSGRTSVLMSTLAVATAGGGVVGLVDTFDRFDARSAARAGVDLDRVLWVRGPALSEGPGPWACRDRAIVNAIRALDLIVRAGGFAVAALDLADAPPRSLRAVPFTTWLRIARANEGHDTVCLLLGDAPRGRSAKGKTLPLTTRRCWAGLSPQRRRFAGFATRP